MPQTNPAPIRYAPACGICPPYSFLIYQGNHAMHCPQCRQVYSCMYPPANYLDVLHELELPHA